MQATKAAAVTRRPFTIEEYTRMSEAGILHPDERTELINGEIYSMAPIGSWHAATVHLFNRWFSVRVGERATISIQSPIRLPPRSEPEPDVALLRFRADFYRTQLPGPEDVLLIIEVADSSLGYDQHLKLPRYAAAGIPEVWIADVQTKRLLVHRGPDGDHYLNVLVIEPGGAIAPLAFTDLVITWDEIFGDQPGDESTREV
ncbi:MAG: Uma2 family endonuclease [Chloroflexi bacterium]|nr:Uma2 family endonuclease [Chloroflexota bacterium]